MGLRLGLGPVIAVAGGRAGAGFRNQSWQTSTVHHDSEAFNFRAIYDFVSVKSRELARETDRSIPLHCHTDYS